MDYSGISNQAVIRLELARMECDRLNHRYHCPSLTMLCAQHLCVRGGIIDREKQCSGNILCALTWVVDAGESLTRLRADGQEWCLVVLE